MPPVKSVTSSKWEIEFLGEPLAELSDNHLPTLGEVLRHFYYHRAASPQNVRQRAVASIVMKRCIEIWAKFDIPTVLHHNLTKNFLKVFKLFTHMPYGTQEGSFQRKRRELLWRKKLSLVYYAAVKDAEKKCNSKSKKLLLAIKREAKEFEQIERTISYAKKKFNEEEVAAALGLKEAVKKQASLISKAESAQSAEHAKKRKGSPEPKVVTYPDNLKEPKLEPSSGFTDLQPNGAEIVRPDSPPAIIKEEINVDWDENDNRKLSKLYMALYLVDYIAGGCK